MGNSEIAEIERQIKEAREFVKFADAVKRLRTNKDFQEVVAKGYFEREAIRLVHAKGDVALQSPDSQRSIVTQMDAIANFSGFLTAALRRGEIAAKQVADGESAIEEMNAAEGEE